MQQEEVVRQQHAVVVEALQAAQVHLGDAQTMPGDADMAHEAFLPGTHQRLERAARPVGDLPLVLLDEVVQLDQVDAVDAEPDEGALETCPGLVALRSEVFVATKKPSRCRANQGAIRSSESP